MPLTSQCCFSSMSITQLLASLSLGFLLPQSQRREVLGKHLNSILHFRPAREGNGLPAALDKPSLPTSWASGQYIFFVRCSLRWDAKRVPAMDFINSTISRSEFNATNTMPFFYVLCQGYFFLTPCVTSCYFSTNVGRQSTAGRAKQHSVSQTAECIHAEMNSQFQSALKIKSIRKKDMPLLLPLTPALTAASHCTCYSSDLDSGNSQKKVITEFQSYIFIFVLPF